MQASVYVFNIPPSLQSSTAAVAFPAGFLPTQRYSPTSCGTALLMISAPPLVTVILLLFCKGMLFFSHEMVGVGTPTATQCSSIVLPTFRGTSSLSTLTRGMAIR